MGTSTGQQYPLSIQAKLPLISTARSKGQFKPPKRALPRDETDSSIDDNELRSIYEVRLEVTMLCLMFVVPLRRSVIHLYVQVVVQVPTECSQMVGLVRDGNVTLLKPI